MGSDVTQGRVRRVNHARPAPPVILIHDPHRDGNMIIKNPSNVSPSPSFFCIPRLSSATPFLPVHFVLHFHSFISHLARESPTSRPPE